LPSSGSLRNNRLSAAAVALLVLAAAAAWLPGSAAAAEPPKSLELYAEPAGEELFRDLPSGGAVPNPAAGQVVLVGRYDRLDIADLSQITLEAPGGRRLPLMVESSSIFVEFGKVIAALRFCAVMNAAEAAPGSGPFVLRWGPDVRADNTKIEKISADGARRDLYRSLRPRSGAASSVATLEVIADSSAEYHFLWYLLPMALVFGLLLLRKLRPHDEAPRPAP
jgi:hypothetical protein